MKAWEKDVQELGKMHSVIDLGTSCLKKDYMAKKGWDTYNDKNRHSFPPPLPCQLSNANQANLVKLNVLSALYKVGAVYFLYVNAKRLRVFVGGIYQRVANGGGGAVILYHTQLLTKYMCHVYLKQQIEPKIHESLSRIMHKPL